MEPNVAHTQTHEDEWVGDNIKSRYETQLEIGDMAVVQFSDELHPRTRQPNKISKMGGRKHILPDNLSPAPIANVPYVVNIVDDTNPGAFGGMYKAVVVRPTVFGKMMLDMSQDGWRFHSNANKKLYDSHGTLRSKEEVEENSRMINGYGDDVEVFVTDVGDSGQDKPSDQMYGVWVREKSKIPGSPTSPMRRTPFSSTSEVGTETASATSSARVPLPAAAGIPLPRVAPDPAVATPIQMAIPEKIHLPEKERDYIPPFEIMENGNLRFLDIEVETVKTPGKRIPSKEKFEFFTHDAKTMDLVYRIASAYNRRSPFFVEGGTATSKTSAAEYFAHLIGADVYRLNLSGQTDTSELIGKFIPNDGEAQRQYEELISGWNDTDESKREAAYSRLSKESAEILKAANEKSLILTKEQCQKIAKNEGLVISDKMWMWKDGIVPTAMKKGGIVILDEATLSVPEILERLNSVLEKPPTLVMSENGGYTIGPDGDSEVHPNFWIMGTGNSAGMAGRNPFTEAFQRRLADYYNAPDPTKTEYEHMLTYMIHGTQPTLEIGGIKYSNPEVANSPYAFLRSVPNVNKFIKHLAALHEDMVKITDLDKGTIGKERRKGGKYTITRQNLMSVMEFLSNEKILDVKETARTRRPVYANDWTQKTQLALERFYADPVQEQDRKAVKDAIGKYTYFKGTGGAPGGARRWA